MLTSELKNYRNETKLKAKAELFAKRAKQLANRKKQLQDYDKIQVNFQIALFYNNLVFHVYKIILIYRMMQNPLLKMMTMNF